MCLGRYARARMKNEKIYINILKIVIKNWKYFKSNPKHLAWAMMHYGLAHMATRRLFDYWGNPKYPIQSLGEEYLSSEDADLLYDAWAVTVSNDIKFPDVNPKLPLHSKMNKTVEDWVNLLTDPRYEYQSLYTSAARVKDTLLCTIGTGRGWNSDGYIVDQGPSGVDETIFAGYTRCGNKVNKKIKDAILALAYHPILKKESKRLMSIAKINAGVDPAAKDYVNNLWKIEEKIGIDVERAKRNLKFVCYLDLLIDIAAKWNSEDWENARLSNTYRMFNYTLNVAEVQSNFFGSHYMFIEELKHPDRNDADYRIDDIFGKPGEEVVFGWDAIKKFVDRQNEFKSWRRSFRNEESKSPKHYPLSTYSLMMKMPENAHHSYVEAGIEIAQEILNDPNERKSSYELARIFLDKWCLTL